MKMKGKMPYLSRDKYGRSEPGYPAGIGQGSSQPEGYQKEHRAHKPSSAGTKVPIKKRSMYVEPSMHWEIGPAELAGAMTAAALAFNRAKQMKNGGSVKERLARLEAKVDLILSSMKLGMKE